MSKRSSLAVKMLFGLLALALAPGRASAGEPKKLLIINSQTGDPYDPIAKAMLDELKRVGFDEGNKSLEVKTYYMGNNDKFMERIWTEQKVETFDVIYLGGTTAVRAAKEKAFNDPKLKFVIAGATDPVGIGVIDNFSSPPKANFTGVTFPVPVRKRLEFLKAVLPSAKKIGYIYADMPQSHSYNKWLKEALAEPEFKDLQFNFVQVPFVMGDGGSQRMARLAKFEAAKLDKEVDAFLAPSDQMGCQVYFAKELSTVITKPLIGILKTEVAEKAGAVGSIYAPPDLVGKRIAHMIADLFSGKAIKSIVPEYPPVDTIFDGDVAKKLGVNIPKKFEK